MRALILVDIQNDFVTGGALAVNEGEQIVPVVNKILAKFDLVVATQDWHPQNHGSFAANHKGKKIGDIVDLAGTDQYLWPVHCVQNSNGAQFHSGLDTSQIDTVFQKGTDPTIDSYSGFFDNGHKKSTGLADFLKEKGVKELFICGLATDYCVKFTTLDAINEGFSTTLIEDACRGVNLSPEDSDNAIAEMQSAGCKVLQSSDIG